jgi:hypothetical protein
VIRDERCPGGVEVPQLLGKRCVFGERYWLDRVVFGRLSKYVLGRFNVAIR